jgi:hypothetical protein
VLPTGKKDHFMLRTSFLAGVALATAALASTPASAAFYLALGDMKISGSHHFGNSLDANNPQWGVTMKFENDGANAVKITITTNTTLAGFNLKRVAFNIATGAQPYGDSSSFFSPNGNTFLGTVSNIGGVAGQTNGQGPWEAKKDGQQIDVTNEKKFDIAFNFHAQDFLSSAFSVWRIVAPGLTEENFKYKNNDGFPDFNAGVHYGHDGGGGSSAWGSVGNPHLNPGGFSPVPLPASLSVLLIAGGLLVAFRGMGFSIV